jgi:hypothetical protein
MSSGDTGDGGKPGTDATAVPSTLSTRDTSVVAAAFGTGTGDEKRV